MKTILRYLRNGFLLVLAIVLAWHLWVLGHIVWWESHAPSQTNFMARRLAAMQDKKPGATLRYQWVDYARISPNLKRAVVAAEDDTFVDHEGFDWKGIQKAIEKNQKKGKAVSGGSTISQQLAKNLFLSPSRSYLRKLEEAVITLMIEALWKKRRILEVYLNVVEWGDGVFGAEAAARRYYGISAAQLSADQAARLAVMLPSPLRYERNFSPRVAAHAARIRNRMRYSEIP